MPNKKLKKRNKTATANSALITKTIHKHLKATQRMPSLTQISDDTGLSRQAVSKHLQGLKLPSYLGKYKELTDDVMQCLLAACKGGNIHAMKLYFQLVWNWKSPKINDPEVNQDPTTKFIILTGNEAKEHQQELDITPEPTTESIPLNRKIQQEKEMQEILDSEPRVSDDPHPLLKDWPII